MEKYCRYHFLACRNQSPYTPDQPRWYCPQCKLVLNEEDLIELEPCEANKRRSLYIKKTKKQRILIVTILVAIFIIISTVTTIYNSPKAKLHRRIDAFDELYELLVRYGDADQTDIFVYGEDENGDIGSQYSVLSGVCGLGSGYYKYAEYIMDAEFVYEYIDTYSLEEFIAKLCYIFDNRYDYCTSSYEYCTARTINKMLLIALDYTGIEIKPFSMPAQGSKGYYTEHPEEVPKAETWEVSGIFYNSTGENKHRETRTCSTTVTVHGDFLVEHYSGYSYYEGAYEWRDGVFYNELPRWIGKSHDTVYYKGKVIHDDLDGAELFYVGDTCYILYGPEECYVARHTCRNWEVLGQ